ncbi:MAG: hypothetical protein HQL67_04115 [Magnetococcales bacterium]|nr:hypothetical protein [Magnetococcales bacterium]
MEFLDFLYQSAAKAPLTSSINSKKELSSDAALIDNKKNILQLLTLMTMEGDFPINVRIGNQIFDYHSFLKLDMIPGMKEEINLYLIIDALDPAIGNIRIRKSDSVMLRMNTKRYNLSFSVDYLDMVGRNVLKLSFPESLIIRTEKRQGIRISIDAKWGLTTTVTRDAGITFPVKTLNISSGGVYFQPSTKIPQIINGGHIICHFTWKSQKIDCHTNASIIENRIIEDILYYRARFRFEQYDSAMRELEALVATAQLRVIQRRRELFREFKTPTELGMASKNKILGKK